MTRLQSTLTTAGLLATFSGGCALQPALAPEGADGTPVTLDWQKGETFYVATSYRVTGAKTDEIPVNFDDAFDGVATPEFGENWTEDVVWSYQVVESDLVPTPDDELYRFAETSTGVASVAVIKASVDPSLNMDAEILESDPVIYMVFREDRDRMVGLISFVNVSGERVETAYATDELDRSWSTLSQSMMTKAPTYLAPYSARWGNAERTLENGSSVTSIKVTDGVADIFYDDEMGGGQIVSRYEAGQPWPTWTTTGNVDARLMTSADVEDRRWDMGGLNPLPENTADFDYRQALRASINIDSSLTLSAEAIQAGKIEASVAQEYKPWAGAWWPLTKGDLVFGYGGRDTVSDRLKEDIDPIKRDMDKLSAEIREIKEDNEEKEAKVKEYQEKQTELVEKLKEFYGDLLQDLDGGKITYTDGKLTHTEDGWEYELEMLSPMDKYALKEYDNGNTSPNPFFISAWEILNSYNPGGESWWGHCNGWAAAAILIHEPREAIDVQIGGNTVPFTTADVKGLMTESHYSTNSQFYGERYNDEDDDVTDLSPKAFHKLVTFFIQEQGVPMVFDTTATEAVWNFPAYAFDMSITETTPANAESLLNVNTATVEDLQGLPGMNAEIAGKLVEHRNTDGPFQRLSDLKELDFIDDVLYGLIEGLLTIDARQRTFDVSALVTLTTDSVGETHIDGDEPKNFKDTWKYTLVTDADGLVVDGTWANEKDHPDFAWIPYHNPSQRANGGSENPFLSYGNLINIVGEDIERR